MPALIPTWPHPQQPTDGPTLDELSAGAGRVVDDQRELDPAALESMVARLAGALRQRGVAPGDRVAWQLPNRIEVVALYRACWRLGAVAAPVGHQGGHRDLEHVIRTVEPTVVVEPEHLATMIDEGEPVTAPAAVHPRDLALVMHTSGSTSAPKGVMHTHGSLAYKARLMTSVHDLHPDDTILMPAPLAHISGLMNAVTLPGASGLNAVLMARWDPEHALELIERHHVTFMIGPPTFFVSLRGAAGFSPERVRTIRLISSGGAGVTAAFVEETAARFGAVVKRTYGSTEAPTVSTSHAGDDPRRARETDGRPTGSVQVRLGPGDEVWLRGPELFVGYVDPEATAAAVTDDWFRTGDVGRLDADGWLTIVGRIKDIIIRGGENIAAAEVEAHLEAHPAVLQAAAVAQPDDRLGERVCAFVTCEPGRSLDVDDCTTWFAERGVARFKVPEVVIVVDQLPLLAAGKIDRNELRRRAASAQSGADASGSQTPPGADTGAS